MPHDTSRVVERECAAMRRLIGDALDGLDARRPHEVLLAGVSLVLHGVVERLWLVPRHPLIDPATGAALDDEHDRLSEDLQLLGGLLARRTAPPDAEDDRERRSRDTVMLAEALLTRLRAHMARDARVFDIAGERGAGPAPRKDESGPAAQEACRATERPEPLA